MTPTYSAVPPGPAFENGSHSRIFRFVYEGEPAPFHAYLVERYRYGRDAHWRATFYPTRVRLNGNPVDGDTVVRPGDEIAYLHLRAEEPAPPPLGVPLYEDAWLLALEKPDTVPVNPSGVYYFTSLAILAREVFANPELTPVHRLDLETGGPVLFAKRFAYLKAIHRLFQRKAIHKRYRAVVHGRFPGDVREIAGRIVPDADSSIHTRLRLVPCDLPATGIEPGGSLTRVLRTIPHGAFSELVLEPVTGKTNQIRVHLAHLGHPIVGDKKYHPDESVFLDWIEYRNFERLKARLLLPSQALHCEMLTFQHPFTRLPVEVRSPPAIWAAKVSSLAIAPSPIEAASG